MAQRAAIADAPAGVRGRNPLTVSEISHHIRFLLKGSPLLRSLLVRGEVADLTRHTSGRLYFTLRDEGAKVHCVALRPEAQGLSFRLEEGMEVAVVADLEVYPPKGHYELLVKAVEPWGPGAYRTAFLQVRDRLAAEGLLAPELKRPLPPFPASVGLVTSEQGATLADLIVLLGRRYPLATLVLSPAAVQGSGAAEGMVAALHRLVLRGVDLVLLARGGGPAEDLWCFNDEALARAIRACPVPVVSAVGHEGDWTIADYVADHRAPTPSAAASLVAPDVADLTAEVEGLGRELVASSAGRLREASGEFLPWAEALPGSARAALLAAARSLDQLQGELEGAVGGRLGGLGREVEAEALVLGTVDPRAVLSRGYALVSRAGGLITAASEAAVGEVVDVTLAKGWLRCRVLEKG